MIPVILSAVPRYCEYIQTRWTCLRIQFRLYRGGRRWGLPIQRRTPSSCSAFSKGMRLDFPFISVFINLLTEPGLQGAFYYLEWAYCGLDSWKYATWSMRTSLHCWFQHSPWLTGHHTSWRTWSFPLAIRPSQHSHNRRCQWSTGTGWTFSSATTTVHCELGFTRQNHRANRILPYPWGTSDSSGISISFVWHYTRCIWYICQALYWGIVQFISDSASGTSSGSQYPRYDQST